MKRFFLTFLFSLTLLFSLAQPVMIDEPIVIGQGGIYSYADLVNESTGPAIIVATSDTVRIINSKIASRGNIIELTAKDAHVILYNVHGIGLHPKKDRTLKGRFFDSNNQRDINYLRIEHCLLEGTSGIRARDIKGGTVIVRYNLAYHIDGRFAKAAEGEYYGTESFNFRTPADSRQFIAMRNCQGLKKTVIAWNKVINVSGTGDDWQAYAQGLATPLPAQEDIFNLNAAGQKGDSIYVLNNLAVGAYQFQPEYVPPKFDNNLKYAGGGFIADGGSCEYLVFEGNYGINLQNYSFSVATGGAIIFRENTAVSSGFLPNGAVSGYNSLALSHQLNNSPGSQFLSNRAAYVRTRPEGNRTGRNDVNFKNCAAGNCPTEGLQANVSLPEGDLFGLDIEVKYIQEWEAKAAAAGIRPGLLQGNPQPPDPPAPTPDPDPVPGESCDTVYVQIPVEVPVIDTVTVIVSRTDTVYVPAPCPPAPDPEPDPARAYFLLLTRELEAAYRKVREQIEE